MFGKQNNEGEIGRELLQKFEAEEKQRWEIFRENLKRTFETREKSAEVALMEFNRKIDLIV